MRITDKQQELLDSLVCERLSSRNENLRLVGCFCNARNDKLEPRGLKIRSSILNPPIVINQQDIRV